MFPLSAFNEFSFAAELAIALVLGVGFGFALERAGFGSARKLTAVFYLYDMAVTKVMFTAVVTTLVGLAVLSGVGLFDMAEIYLEPTNWTAQIVGGALFGAGFVVGGYCPGTAMAAIATGRKDGMLFAAGMLAGVWAYAEFTPGLDDWYKATSSGVITLPEATGIAMGWWALAFVAFLAFGAWGMAKLEKRFAYLNPAP
ncbi:MAG: YeeE/YedE thiosulfate transporter family protein [Rubrivivax sp.]|nr:YeeE/YedE thiosulfate transporter family protein [Rubrivivax sp.]